MVYKTPIENNDYMFLETGPPKGALASLLTATREEDRFKGFIPVRLGRYAYSLNTPAMQWMMNYLIELTIQKNTSPPIQLVIPDGPYTHESVYAFIGDAMDHLDSVETPVPDITQKASPSVARSNKMRFYHELEEELLRTGVDFAAYAGRREGFLLPKETQAPTEGATLTNEGV
jgi:hypothetical protein